VLCSVTMVFKRRDRPREPLLAAMTTLLATLDLAPRDQTHMEVETLDQAPRDQTHMEVETLALIHMEAEILVQADMEETAGTTMTTTRRVVFV